MKQDSQRILANFGTRVVALARQHAFTVQQTAFALNVAYFVLCVSITKKLTANEVVAIVDSILHTYSHQAPPYSIQILNSHCNYTFIYHSRKQSIKRFHVSILCWNVQLLPNIPYKVRRLQHLYLKHFWRKDKRNKGSKLRDSVRPLEIPVVIWRLHWRHAECWGRRGGGSRPNTGKAAHRGKHLSSRRSVSCCIHFPEPGRITTRLGSWHSTRIMDDLAEKLSKE